MVENNQWSSFANQHAFVSSACLLLGGLISLIGRFKWWPIGIYSIIIGCVILLIEYPRSGRPKTNSNLPQSSSHARAYQHFLTNIYTKLGFLYSNYFPRFLLYLLLSIPCLLTLSTIIPALNLLITSGLYLLSNIRKEKWTEIQNKEEIYRNVTIIQAPERPPPRSISDIEIKT